MKKILSLFALLVAFVMGAQADPTYKSDFTDGQIIWTTASYVDDAVTAGWMKMNSTLSKKDLKGKKMIDPETDEEASSAQYPNTEYFYVQKTYNSKASSDKSLYLYVSGLTKVTFYFYQNSDGGGRTMEAYDGETGDATRLGGADVVSGGRCGYFDVTLDGNDNVIRLNATNELLLYAIKVEKAPEGPTITTQPESAAYATGDPIAALTVEATASAGDLEYQWFTCDDADKTNAAAIDGATSASYTPTAAGFYYVNVADENGDINSDVAEITISAAEAPTINVTGAPASDVLVGTEVILTAETTGTPTPVVTWYDGDTDEEITTGATYTVPTDVAGTFSVYAVASNGVEPDATSATQTIVVKEKVATPTFTPNGAYFQESQEVAIATTTDGATIQYSTDGGSTWADYTEAFSVTATTTVQAKATKAGYIESETATATFTKVELTPQTDVTATVTWDWSTVTNGSAVELDKSPNVLSGVDVTFANIPAYGYTAVAGLDAQDALLMNGQRAYNNANGSKHCQVNYLKFNTTVAGKVTVEYANTGGNAARTVNVNGTKGTKSVTNNTDYETESFDVEAGEVEIKGVQVSDDADKMLRIRKVVFMPTTETISIPEEGVLTYVTQNAVDFSTQNGAFKAYAVTNVGATSATTVQVGQVPAGTPLLIKGTAGDYDVEVIASAEDIENLLLASDGTITGGDNIYAYSKTLKKFKKVASSITIPAGKCYLQATGGTTLDIDFEGEATAIGNVNANDNANYAPVKVITAKGVQIGKFNVAGQQVK